MSLRIGSNLFQLSRSQRFFDSIVEDLVQGRSILILIPENSDPREMWSVLRGKLLHREIDFKEIPLQQISDDRGPVTALSNFLQLEWTPAETPRTLTNLLEFECLPKIIYFDEFHQLPENKLLSWLNFICQWAQTNHSLRVKGQIPKCLCLFTTAPCLLPYLPQSDVYLAIHWWWGIPSALEFRLLCRLEEGDKNSDTKAKWREHILPSIVGNDVALAEYLWDDLHLDIEKLTLRLITFAEKRGWTITALQQWGANSLSELTVFDYRLTPSVLPEQFRNLWGQGALVWTQEYGFELHTAALAVLNRQDELGHRLWRGQSTLLLPEIDMIRLRLCIDFTQSYGQDWPTWYMAGENEVVYDNPLACELGRMELLLMNCNKLRSERRRLLPLVSQLRKIRNQLAHYRPIKFSDYESICQQMDSYV